MSLVGPAIPVSVPRPLVAQRNIQYMVVPGHYAQQGAISYIDRATNTVAATRVKVLHCASWMQSDISGVPSSVQVYSCGFRTSGTMTRVRCSMVLQPLETYDVSAASRLYWQLNPTGGASFDQADLYTEAVDASIQPGDYIRVDQDWTNLDPDTEYTATLNRYRYQRWVSISIYELQNSVVPYLATPAAGVDPARSIVGGEIRSQQIEDLWTSQSNLFQHHGAVFISQSKLEALTWSTTSATAVNIYDNAYTSFNAAAPGHYVRAEYKNARGGSSNPEVSVRFWCYGYVTGGNTATIELNDSSANQCSATTTSGTPVLFYSDTSIPASNQKLDCFIRTTGGTFYVFQWGLYENE